MFWKRFKFTIFALCLCAAAAIPAFSQCTFPCVSVPNETATGTQSFHLAKVTGAPSRAIISTAGDTAGVIGISTNGGTSGNAYIMTGGTAVACTFDGATTAGDYVSISATVNGDCADAGAVCPATENIGRIFTTHGTAGTYPVLMSIGVCSTSVGPVTGTGALPQVAYWTAANVIAGSNALLMTNGSTADSLNLAATTNSTHGVIDYTGVPFIFSFPAASGNIFMGDGFGTPPGNFTTTGADLVGIGDQPLHSNTTGRDNVAIGDQPLHSNTTGIDNVAIGDVAMFSNTTGVSNVGIGPSSLSSNITGSSNVAIGNNAMNNSSAGDNNVAIGTFSLFNNTTGSHNTAVGPRTGSGPMGNNTTGAQNAAFGEDACQTNATGSLNTCLGYAADVGSAALSNATAIGNGAVVASSNEMILGNASVTDVSPGANGTVALGQTGSAWAALYLPLTTSATLGVVNSGANRFLHAFGTGSTFLGSLAGNFTLTGISNTGIGVSALTADTTGTLNTAVGNSALLLNTTGASQTAVGVNALSSATTGGSQTAVGASALALATGINNSGLGVSACGSVTTGTANTCLGFNADTGAALTNTTAIGNGATVAASNTIQLGNTSVTKTITSGAYTGLAFQGTGALPSVGTCGTIGANSKNAAGFITSNVTGACVSVLTFTYTATTGWSCAISNSTTANLIRQTAGSGSTTTATFSGVTVTGDVLPYACTPF